MKILILFLLVIYSSVSFACKPAPLPTCEKLDVKVDVKKFEKIMKVADEAHAFE